MQPIISEVTRRNIFDALRERGTIWSGRLDETEFLSRLYDLDATPSSDGRFPTAEGDIIQHRTVNPSDWPDDWIYTDSRFGLLTCPDQKFLVFLCEMIHPAVRPEVEEVRELLRLFNEHLRADLWELYGKSRLSGRPVFGARRVPPRTRRGNAQEQRAYVVTNAELIREIEAQRDLMIGVATGGPRIQEVQKDYRRRRLRIREALDERGIEDPNPHRDLWSWYGRWSSGDLPTYQSRRQYVGEIYGALIDGLATATLQAGEEVFEEPTGWARVDRGIDRVRRQLETASTEEEFQTVGLLCRETLISLAQAVFDPARHKVPADGAPSQTDAKRMLEAYITVELGGGKNEALRRHATGALTLANHLQHKRTAGFRDAALCAEATTAVVNLVAIVAGRRDP